MNNRGNFIFPGRQNRIEQHGTNFSLNFSQIDGIGRKERLSLSMNFAFFCFCCFFLRFLDFLVKSQKILTVVFEFSGSYMKLTMLSIKAYVGKRKEITFGYFQ